MTVEPVPYSVGFVMLRDHSEKCDHGFCLSHYWNSFVGECPGGREVTDKELIERAGAAAIAQGIAEVLF